MSTPIAIGDRVFCVNRRLECFDVAKGLQSAWSARDRTFCEYGAAIASNDRLLVQGRGGELVLVDTKDEEPRILSRLSFAPDKDSAAAELFTFPALVGTRLYVRFEKEIVCVDLGA